MKHDLRSLDCGFGDSGVVEIAVLERGEAFCTRSTVGTAHGVALVDQLRHEMAADVAVAAGDENVAHDVPGCR